LGFFLRHNLGALFLNSGKYAEAEKIYLEDLQTFKENGWALKDLYHALVKQNKNAATEKVKIRLDKAWEYADAQLIATANF